MSKKLKIELNNSNDRERAFLHLLKQTEEFGDQAKELEKEYDRLLEQGEQQFNLSGAQKYIEVKGAHDQILIPKEVEMEMHVENLLWLLHHCLL